MLAMIPCNEATFCHGVSTVQHIPRELLYVDYGWRAGNRIDGRTGLDQGSAHIVTCWWARPKEMQTSGHSIVIILDFSLRLESIITSGVVSKKELCSIHTRLRTACCDSTSTTRRIQVFGSSPSMVCESTEQKELIYRNFYILEVLLSLI